MNKITWRLSRRNTFFCTTSSFKSCNLALCRANLLIFCWSSNVTCTSLSCKDKINIHLGKKKKLEKKKRIGPFCCIQRNIQKMSHWSLLYMIYIWTGTTYSDTRWIDQVNEEDCVTIIIQVDRALYFDKYMSININHDGKHTTTLLLTSGNI